MNIKSGGCSKSKWGMSEDDKFIGYLLHERELYPLDSSFFIERALRTIQKRLTRSLGREVMLEELRQKFQCLKENYNTFTSIIATPRVIFEEDIDWVYVPLSERAKLESKYPNAKEFFHGSPPHWIELKILFEKTVGDGDGDGDGTQNTHMAGEGHGYNYDNPILLSENSAGNPTIDCRRPPTGPIQEPRIRSDKEKQTLPCNFPLPRSKNLVPSLESRTGAKAHGAAARNQLGNKDLHPQQGSGSEQSTAASYDFWPSFD